MFVRFAWRCCDQDRCVVTEVDGVTINLGRVGHCLRQIETPLHRVDELELRWIDERHDGAPCSRASCAAGAVDIRRVLIRWIEVHDTLDRIDMNPSGRNVGSDERSRFPPSEVIERPLALVL